MSTEVTEHKVRSGALTSHVLMAGDEGLPAAILLHGAGPGASAAANWIRCAPDLAQHFRVVAPDLTGFGQTELPDPLPTHICGWMGLRVEQVLGLMDELGIERAHVVGNSMGGALTVNLLQDAPERFDRVVLMGPIGAPMRRTPEMVRLLSFYEDPRPRRYREMMRSFVHDPDAVPELEEIIAQRYQVAIRPDVRRVQEVMFAAMREGMDEINIPPSSLARLPHRVLLCHGRQDRIVPLETSLYYLEHLQHAELRVLDRCGHWAQTQRWDAMLPLIVEHFTAP